MDSYRPFESELVRANADPESLARYLVIIPCNSDITSLTSKTHALLPKTQMNSLFQRSSTEKLTELSETPAVTGPNYRLIFPEEIMKELERLGGEIQEKVHKFISNAPDEETRHFYMMQVFSSILSGMEKARLNRIRSIERGEIHVETPMLRVRRDLHEPRITENIQPTLTIDLTIDDGCTMAIEAGNFDKTPVKEPRRKVKRNR